MTVILTVDEGLATITLARPKAHNALDVTTKVALRDAVAEVAANPGIRAVLLAAEGKNFCVGQDLGEHVAALESNPSTAMATVDEHYNPLIRALADLRVPVIAAIGGACVGAGFGIALTADIRVIGEGTSFGTAFTAIGLAADSGLSHSLVAALGPSRASGLLLLGDKIDAEQASAWGLVHRVVPDEDILSTAHQLARRLAHGPTLAFGEVKSLVKASSAGLGDALERESAAQLVLGATADHKGAVDAFLAKQTPTFEGR